MNAFWPRWPGTRDCDLTLIDARRRPVHNLRREFMAAARKTSDTDAAMTREIIIVNKLGIHARPAAMFVKTANRFHSEILVEKDGEKVNGKSIMGLMMLAAGPGSKLRVEALGHDAAQALAEIEALITQRKFDEE